MILMKSAGDWVDDFITNANLASGDFDAITGVGIQSQTLDMGTQLIDNVNQIATGAIRDETNTVSAITITDTTGAMSFNSRTITNFGLNCDGTGNSCTNVDTADFIGVAEPKLEVFTCGAGMSQVTNTPNKRTEDASNYDYVVCEFDTTTAETIIWTTYAPDNFDSTGTIDVTVNVVVDTGGNTASACFDVAFLGLAQDAVVNTAFPAPTGGCTGTMVIGDFEQATMTGITSGTHGIAPNELVMIELARDVAADSNTGDVGVISIEVEWN